jgi:ribosomal protein S12 methylthiotransferase accessory factor YcaO
VARSALTAAVTAQDEAVQAAILEAIERAADHRAE